MMDPMQTAAAGNGRRRESDSRANGSDESITPSLFDAGLDEARSRRDAGMKTAEHAAHPWVRSAIDRWIAERVEPFTSDTIRADIAPLASSPNIVGARINAAARRGEIEFTEHVQSTRPEARGRYIKVWHKVGGGA